MVEEQDEELGTVLSARLHEELADLTAAPGLAATVRRRRSRQRWTLTGGLVLPVVAVGVVVALAVTSATTGVRGGPPRSGEPQPHTVAYVVARSEEALDGTRDSISYTVVNRDDGSVGHFWTDSDSSRTLMVSRDGPVNAPTLAVRHIISGGRATVLTVDYAHHVWWQKTYPYTWPAGRTPAPNPPKSLPGNSDDIRTQLANGDLILVGIEQVAGHTAEHLRTAHELEPGHYMDIWVDSTTYLPVRMAIHAGQTSWSITYEWLPRTPENLARLELTPPAGFTEQPAK